MRPLKDIKTEVTHSGVVVYDSLEASERPAKLEIQNNWEGY
jgi:hypothetical protein